MAQPSVSIAIPALNEAARIGALLGDIASLPENLVERVIVFDGRSTDGTREVATGRGIDVIDNPRRHAAGARQLALESITSDYVCFLDADCRLADGWAASLARGVDSGVDGFGGPVLPADSTNPVALFSARVFKTVMAFDDVPRTLSAASVNGSIAGGNCVLRREVALAAGGFDLSIKNYGEDLDLLWRMLKRGATINYLPEMKVTHHFPDSRRKLVHTWFKYGRASSALAARHLKTPAVDGGFWLAAIRTGVRSLRPSASGDRLSFLQLSAHLAGKVVGSVVEGVVNL